MVLSMGSKLAAFEWFRGAIELLIDVRRWNGIMSRHDRVRSAGENLFCYIVADMMRTGFHNFAVNITDETERKLYHKIFWLADGPCTKAAVILLNLLNDI